ncbi:dihydrofolate synthase/folylpolyglutamate synthase [Rubritalea halochordaticola]|uniref:Dihydrofolate synthase/folylpolyglutamate synthase n=1 Tax=Rubritalea halochordaticola TaxID=714537 RepID=A0ABP9V3I4_9BACT
MTYQEALDWLYSTQTFGIKLGLDGPRKLLRQFLSFPKSGVKVIHVAGTNGKGSTCAFIDSLCRTSAYRTGLFTSPHLVDYRERIRVNGEMIPEETVAEYLTELRELVAEWEHHPTFFELTLAVAMRHFRETECEVIVLETGMGGRLDATTAVPADVAVITPIALDHSQWLGDTLEKVAFEKAGIILEDKPTISAKQEREAAIVIAEQANEMRSPLTVIEAPLTGYSLSLAGPHQAYNAHLALEAANAIGIPLNFDSVQYAMSHTNWPGRFETVSDTPTIIIDGAHNPHAAAALLQTWEHQFGSKKPIMLFGAVESKDVTGALKLLCQLPSELHLVKVNTARGLPTETLLEALPKDCPPHTEHDSLQSALDVVIPAAVESGTPILISGSLFLIGEAKSILQGGSFQASTQ